MHPKDPHTLRPLDSFIESRQRLGRPAFRKTLTTPMLAIFIPQAGGDACYAVAIPPQRETQVCVGRSASCDLSLPHDSLSRRHAQFIISEAGSMSLVDRGSTNGTLINGRALTPNVPRPLEVGDTVQFGEVVAILHSPATFYQFVLIQDAATNRHGARARARARAVAAR